MNWCERFVLKISGIEIHFFFLSFWDPISLNLIYREWFLCLTDLNIVFYWPYKNQSKIRKISINHEFSIFLSSLDDSATPLSIVIMLLGLFEVRDFKVCSAADDPGTGCTPAEGSVIVPGISADLFNIDRTAGDGLGTEYVSADFFSASADWNVLPLDVLPELGGLGDVPAPHVLSLDVLPELECTLASLEWDDFLPCRKIATLLPIH